MVVVFGFVELGADDSCVALVDPKLDVPPAFCAVADGGLAETPAAVLREDRCLRTASAGTTAIRVGAGITVVRWGA